MLPQHGGHLDQHLAEAQLCERRAVVLVHEGLDLGLELGEVGLPRIARPVEQDLGHGLRVALYQPEQQRQQLFAPARRQPPHHAEIDEGQTVAGQVEDVAGVRVGVEEAVLDDHLHHRLGAALREHLAVQPRGVHGGQVLAGHTVDQILHIHARGGVLPVHARNPHVVQRREVARDAFGMAAFGSQIQLSPQRTGELAHQLLGAVGRQRGPLARGHAGQALEQPEIGVDHGFDAGAAHLHHHLGAVVQPGAVHLRDGRGSERRGVELREYRLGLAAQVFAKLRPQGLERQRGHPAVQLAELGDPLGAQEVASAGQHLAELDEGGAQLLEGEPHLFRRRQPGQVGCMFAVEHAPGARQRVGQSEPAHGLAQAVPQQHGPDLLHPTQILHAAQCVEAHGRKYEPLSPCCGGPGSIRPGSGTRRPPRWRRRQR